MYVVGEGQRETDSEAGSILNTEASARLDLISGPPRS